MSVQSPAYPRNASPIAARWRSDVPVRYAASTLALTVDAAVVVAISVLTGAGFEWAARGTSGDVMLFAGTGAMVAVLFLLPLRLPA